MAADTTIGESGSYLYACARAGRETLAARCLGEREGLRSFDVRCLCTEHARPRVEPRAGWHRRLFCTVRVLTPRLFMSHVLK